MRVEHIGRVFHGGVAVEGGALHIAGDLYGQCVAVRQRALRGHQHILALNGNVRGGDARRMRDRDERLVILVQGDLQFIGDYIHDVGILHAQAVVAGACDLDDIAQLIARSHRGGVRLIDAAHDRHGIFFDGDRRQSAFGGDRRLRGGLIGNRLGQRDAAALLRLRAEGAEIVGHGNLGGIGDARDRRYLFAVGLPGHDREGHIARAEASRELSAVCAGVYHGDALVFTGHIGRGGVPAIADVHGAGNLRLASAILAGVAVDGGVDRLVGGVVAIVSRGLVGGRADNDGGGIHIPIDAFRRAFDGHRLGFAGFVVVVLVGVVGLKVKGRVGQLHLGERQADGIGKVGKRIVDLAILVLRQALQALAVVRNRLVDVDTDVLRVGQVRKANHRPLTNPCVQAQAQG